MEQLIFIKNNIKRWYHKEKFKKMEKERPNEMEALQKEN